MIKSKCGNFLPIVGNNSSKCQKRKQNRKIDTIKQYSTHAFDFSTFLDHEYLKDQVYFQSQSKYSYIELCLI